jgi:hypothetical protein
LKNSAGRAPCARSRSAAASAPRWSRVAGHQHHEVSIEEMNHANNTPKHDREIIASSFT